MAGAGEVASEIKLRLPSKPIIMVGGHVSALPERTLREEAIDYACDGEGPITIEDLLNGCPLDLIPGLVWRKGDEIVKNKPARLLSPAELHGNVWHMLPITRYRAHQWQCFGDLSQRQPYASIYTSLNCPFKCLSGDTPINTIYGNIPIREIAERFAEVPVFTYDPISRRGRVSTARNIKKYGADEKLVRVNFDDGSHIDCTPDHQFLVFKWSSRGLEKEWPEEAQNLRPGMHLRALKFNTFVRYPVAAWSRRGRSAVHRMVAEWKIGRKLERAERVHHIDHIPTNWHPDNLQVFSDHAAHFAEHREEVSLRMKKNNPTKNGMSAEWIANLRKSITGLKRTPESKERYRAAAIQREAGMKGKVWWTEPDGKTHLSVKPRSPNAIKGKPRGIRWWTTPTGETYSSIFPRMPDDVLGRKGFNAHASKSVVVNHRVVSVEALYGGHDVYCMEVPDTGWFYANNVLVKNCSFCCISAPFHGNKYQVRDAESVVNEIEMLHSMYGVKTFKIVDEMFVLRPSHYENICTRLIDFGLGDKINIWSYARVDSVKPENLALLRAAGIRWLALGIESGSKHVRDGADKVFKNDDIVGVVRAIQAAGICVIGNFMYGLEDDTHETMQATLDLALELRCEFANFYSTMAYPGSKLYADAVASGARLPASWLGYSQHAYETQPMDTAHIKAEAVLRFRDEAFMTYFTDPGYIAMVRHKFGLEAVQHIMKMTSHHINRRLLEVE